MSILQTLVHKKAVQTLITYQPTAYDLQFDPGVEIIYPAYSDPVEFDLAVDGGAEIIYPAYSDPVEYSLSFSGE